MPTGWRPSDVIEKFPRPIITDLNNRVKYSHDYSTKFKWISVFHFIAINFLVFFFLYNFSYLSSNFQISFGFIIFASIFGFTSFLDLYAWASKFEIFRGLACIFFLIHPSNEFLIENYFFFYVVMFLYFICVILISITYRNKFKK